MKCRWKHRVLLCVLVVAVLIGGQRAEAAGTRKVTGVCRYSESYAVLKLLNKERQKNGLGKLSMDKQLLEAAMLRLAELTISFSHYRPNGAMCFSACEKMYAENIAYGYGSASAVMEAWLGSPGHCMNMMTGDYRSVGIGCFYKGGVRYWVQCFGYDKANKISEPTNLKRTYKVSLRNGVETSIAGSEPLATGVEKFTVTVGKQKLTLKWKKKSGISGYQVQISTTKTFNSRQTYNIGIEKTKKVLVKCNGKKLKNRKKYYIRIRAYKEKTGKDGSVTTKYSKWNTISGKTK